MKGKSKEKSDQLLHLLKGDKAVGDENEVDGDKDDEKLDANAIAEMKANELEAIEVEILQKRARNEAPERGYQGTRRASLSNCLLLTLTTQYTYAHTCTHTLAHPHSCNRRIKWHSSFWEHAFVYEDTGRSM